MLSRAFISHATADRERIEREMCGLLRALGLQVCFAEEDIQTAQQWERAILAGLEKSRWFILAMSTHSVGSEWIRDETHWAIEEREDHFIPILLDDCDPKQFHIRLPRIQYLDFRHDTRKARERLVALIVEREYREGAGSCCDLLYPGIKAVVQSCDLPMYFIDCGGKVKFYNNLLTSLLGFKRSELENQTVQVLVDRLVSLAPRDTQELLRVKQERLLQAGIPDHSEEDHVIDLRHMAGSRYQGIKRVWISADRVYDHECGRALGVFVICHVMAGSYLSKLRKI